jgi:FlaA1/EpsC-like NDP-sugar epimerase
MENAYKDKIILVTGGTGSIGSELVRQLLIFGPKQIRVLSRNENRQAYLANELNDPRVRMLIGDIRDYERLMLATQGVDIIFHAAAMKHVPSCEYNPFEAVKTNIVGSQNVIQAALFNKVPRLIAISTDKAANPFSVMGVSKLMMEKLVTHTNFSFDSQIKTCCVRFGNVAWAEGSVFPLWERQAKKRGTINVTNRKMTRFLMSIQQAVQLTLRAGQLSKGGEIFILKMPAAKISDMASIFLKKYFPKDKIKVMDIGDRPGEKMHEDLLGASDWVREIHEDPKMFILVPGTDVPNLVRKEGRYVGFKQTSIKKNFCSNKKTDINKIAEFI